MKKIKKFIAVALATTMLIGGTMMVNAAGTCPKCTVGYATDVAYGFCNKVTFCHAPVYKHVCKNCGTQWVDMCTAGHWQ